MDLTQQSKQHVLQVARDALDQFDKVATAAQTAIFNAPPRDRRSGSSQHTNGRRSGSTAWADQPGGTLKATNLAREPAIARVAVLMKRVGKRVYYICRMTPITGVSNLASYRAPVGRLASLPVGTEFSLTEW